MHASLRRNHGVSSLKTLHHTINNVKIQETCRIKYAQLQHKQNHKI